MWLLTKIYNSNGLMWQLLLLTETTSAGICKCVKEDPSYDWQISLKKAICLGFWKMCVFCNISQLFIETMGGLSTPAEVQGISPLSHIPQFFRKLKYFLIKTTNLLSNKVTYVKWTLTLSLIKRIGKSCYHWMPLSWLR